MNILQSFATAILKANSGTGSANDTTTIYNVPTYSASTIFANGLNIVYIALGTVAVVVIIVAGIMYTTSGGNAANVTKAKNAIVYAAIGLVVVLLAFTITQFVTGRI